MTASFAVGYLAGLLTMVFVIAGMGLQAVRADDRARREFGEDEDGAE